MTFYSPLRYPGGKKRLVNFFKEVVIKNSLQGGIYVEPYAGGASIALSLLIEGYVSKVIINDLDRSIYAFWYSVLFRTKDLCDLIKKTPVNIKTWKIQKKIQKKKDKENLLKLGFSTFFLNRTNRSGIINAGAIGGLNQKGFWKINARYNKKDLIERIKRISDYKNQIEVCNDDAITLLKRMFMKLPEKTLFYLDPPDYDKGKELYMNHYDDKNHQELANIMRKFKDCYWIITYDNVKKIKQLYPDFRKSNYSLNYSAGHAKKGKEIRILSNKIR